MRMTEQQKDRQAERVLSALYRAQERDDAAKIEPLQMPSTLNEKAGKEEPAGTEKRFVQSRAARIDPMPVRGVLYGERY